MWADQHDEVASRLTRTHRTFERLHVDESCATRADQPDRLDLAVTDRDSGEWVGEVVIDDRDPDNRSCGFRIALGPNGGDRGLGTEATRLIVDDVFDRLDDPPVNRLSLEVYDSNPRALAVYEQVGFRKEGRLRRRCCGTASSTTRW